MVCGDKTPQFFNIAVVLEAVINIYGIYFVDNEQSAIERAAQTIPWQDYGFEIIGSNTNALAAVREIAELKPDLVICDWLMPAMDGTMFISKVKQTGINCEFILLTAYKSTTALLDFFHGGGSDYWLKPINRQEIEAALKRLQSKINAKYQKPMQ
jgi:two-component system response regulator YesN